MKKPSTTLLNAITVIRHAGDPDHAETLLGQKVERKEQLYVKEWGAEIPVTPYDNHFIYATNKNIKGLPSFMCTCGSPAVVASSEKIRVRKFVCLIHATSGRHTTGT